MIEVDPVAQYSPAQVATLLNIPESQVQDLWQQFPVCGYEVLAYCHRQGIPHTMQPLPPESAFGRAIRLGMAKSENRTEQEIIPMRDHYRRMSPEEREQFANLIRSLATATEEFSVLRIYVRVNYWFDAYDEQGNNVYAESAEASPEAILKIMPFWGETADISE